MRICKNLNFIGGEARRGSNALRNRESEMLEVWMVE